MSSLGGMQQNNYHYQEKVRQHALREYHILHTGKEKEFDDITSLTALICDMPRSLINLIDGDKVWHKSTYGVELSSTPREKSLCQFAIEEDQEILILNDPENDFRFGAIDHSHEISFYAGVPLKNPDGIAIGTLCVYDSEKHEFFSEKYQEALISMARQIMILLEQRKLNHKLQEMHQKLKEKNMDLEKFASVISHDIKSPLANIISLTTLLREEVENLNEETREYLDYLSQSSNSLRNYVDGIIAFYKSDYILDKEYEDVGMSQLFKPIVDLYKVNRDVTITHPDMGILHNVNKAALTQIFLNLIGNALKYNDKEFRKVEIRFRESETEYIFDVEDNGKGIPQQSQEKIFELFTTLNEDDRDGNPGSGIGLATVKKLVESMGGKISVYSVVNVCCIFTFSVRRF